MEGAIKRAVLTDEYAAYIDDIRKVRRRNLTVVIAHLTDLWGVAQQLQTYRLWITPSALKGLIIDDSNEEYKVKISYENEVKKEQPRYALVKKNGVEVAVGWSHHWPWRIETAFDMLVTLDYIVLATGREPEWSPVQFGRAKFRDKYHATNALREKVKDPEIDLFDTPFIHSASVLYWLSSQLKEWIKEGLFLHHIDRRLSFSTSSKSVYVGWGNLRKVEADYIRTESNETGIYCVIWDAALSDFDGIKLPTIFTTGQAWVTADQLVMAKNNGYEIQILEGYIWEHSSQLFRTWADAMFSYRDTLTDTTTYKYERARVNAELTMKVAANATIGSFGSKRFQEFRRPDWERAIVGKARCTVLAALKHFKHLCPVLVVSDDIWFLSSEPDIEKALGEMFERRNLPGGFRPLGTVAVTKEIVQKVRVSTDAIALHTFLKGKQSNATPHYTSDFAEIRTQLKEEYGDRGWIREYLKAAGLRNESIPAKQDKEYLAARRSLERYEINQNRTSIYTKTEYAEKVGKTLEPVGYKANQSITVTLTGHQQGRTRHFTATFKGIDAQAFVSEPSTRAIFRQYAIDTGTNPKDIDYLVDLWEGDSADYGDDYGVDVSGVA